MKYNLVNNNEAFRSFRYPQSKTIKGKSYIKVIHNFKIN